MPRSNLEHWLHGHLLKICLPHERPFVSDRPVHAPLNLTAFLRLVARMHEVGYPAHWLSGTLASICEGSITTTARAPRQLVLTTEDVAKSYPFRKISLGPWKAEYTTLLSIWRRFLPFGVIAPENSLVPLSDIVECSITFPDFPHHRGRISHFAVTLFNIGMLGDRDFELPRLIQDDEKGMTSEFANRFREKGVHIVTAFQYVTGTRTATLWLRRDVVDEVMRDDAWAVGICRTDSWKLIMQSVETAKDVLQQVRPWSSSA